MTPALHFTRFGRYEIIRKLGRSMTDVYLALDPDANRRVVLKIVEQFRDTLTQQVVEAERRGAAIQQQLHDLDPAILEIYECGDLNGCFYLAMQYAEGHTLAELIRKDSRVSPDNAARYAAEICRQLQTLHSFQAEFDGQKRAVVHGDIKPSNIQVGSHGELWLLDFGIAKAISATRNLTQHSFGSPAYCSPERLKNGQVDPQADLWAVGVCLYEMLAGIPPYQAQSTRKLEILIQSRRPPRALPDDCPPSLKAVIRKALAGDSSRRYMSAMAFERDLRLFLERKPTAAETEREPSWDSNATLEHPHTDPPPRPPRRNLRFSRFVAELNVVLWSIIAGVVVGLLLFVPVAHAYRFWKDGAPLRAVQDARRSTVAEIESNTRLYTWIEQTYPTLLRWWPGRPLRSRLTSQLEAAGNSVLDAFRNSSDNDVSHFDWSKARTCFERLQQVQPAPDEIRGKAALAAGYEMIVDGSARAAFQKFQAAAQLLPESPDPHLALARLYIREFHNLGAAAAEFHAAESAGYKLGPREFEMQADGYLYRAEHALNRWRQTRTSEQQKRWENQMRRDFERAREIYEPIEGYSNVDRSLDRLDKDEAWAEQIRSTRERAKLQASRRRSQSRRWR
jgi:serine/threonine protein kinase